MAESDMRGYLVTVLKPLDALPVENPVRPGTPDINYIEGWIEAKWMRRWPRNAYTSPVLIPHFTPQQRAWLRRRWHKGGRSWLMLQVQKEWLLFTGEDAAEYVGNVDRACLEKIAFRHWRKGLQHKELITCLSSSQHLPMGNAA